MLRENKQPRIVYQQTGIQNEDKTRILLDKQKMRLYHHQTSKLSDKKKIISKGDEENSD